MRASTVAFAIAFAVLTSCATGTAMAPSVPADAILDEYDAELLVVTSAQAPTFAEVASPRDETPRRFRAWLGWTSMSCEPCPPDQTATCTPQCTPGKPFVCARPSRMIACSDEETVSIRVSNGEDAVPSAGAYILEGTWAPPADGGASEFVVTRVDRLELPVAEGR
jgi:hypothetical protein